MKREEKDQLQKMHEDAVLQRVMGRQPLTYLQRNVVYVQTTQILSYPLQGLSIAGGGYLLFDVLRYVYASAWNEAMQVVGLLGCFGAYACLESLRRKKINDIGLHWVATFRIEAGKLQAGEFLRSATFFVLAISVAMIGAGTFGAYQYAMNNGQQASKIDVKHQTLPLANKLAYERQQIASLDKSIQALQTGKAGELRDHKNYAVWEGKEYLLPEAKARHEQYDRQIAAMQQQRQKHLDLVGKYEEQNAQQQARIEKQNAVIEETHQDKKLAYSWLLGVFFFVFECVLLLMLGYGWYYEYMVKRGVLLAHLAQPSKNAYQGVKIEALPTNDATPQQKIQVSLPFAEVFPIPNTCAACAKPLQNARAKFCSNACKQKNHRKKQTT